MVEGDSNEDAYVLPIDKVAAIGKDAVTVSEATDIMLLSQIFALKKLIEQEPAIKDVFFTDGEPPSTPN